MRRVAVALFWSSLLSRYLTGIARYTREYSPWELVTLTYLHPHEQYHELRTQQFDGLFCSTEANQREDRDILQIATERIVLLNRNFQRKGIASLKFDAAEAAAVRYEYLKRLKISSLGVLALEQPAGGFSSVNWLERAADTDGLGCTRFVFSTRSAFARPTNPNIPQTLDEFPGDFVEWARLLPTGAGVICLNDRFAQVLLQICKLLHRRVPDEIAIVGEGESIAALLAEPAITVLQYPSEELGYQAARLMHRWLDGTPPATAPVLVSGCQLIERESSRKHPPDILSALHYIQKQACHGLSIRELVTNTQTVSRATFEKRFLESVGRTPAEEIRRVKLKTGERLLADTDWTVLEVAIRCGFESVSQFTLQFRRMTGMSPGEFRSEKQR